MENQHKLIEGYRDLSQPEINLINQIKINANQIADLVGYLEHTDVDQRWVAIGKTDLQKGFMAIIRAVAKPESF